MSYESSRPPRTSARAPCRAERPVLHDRRHLGPQLVEHSRERRRQRLVAEICRLTKGNELARERELEVVERPAQLVRGEEPERLDVLLTGTLYDDRA